MKNVQGERRRGRRGRKRRRGGEKGGKRRRQCGDGSVHHRRRKRQTTPQRCTYRRCVMHTLLLLLLLSMVIIVVIPLRCTGLLIGRTRSVPHSSSPLPFLHRFLGKKVVCGFPWRAIGVGDGGRARRSIPCFTRPLVCVFSSFLVWCFVGFFCLVSCRARRRCAKRMHAGNAFSSLRFYFFVRGHPWRSVPPPPRSGCHRILSPSHRGTRETTRRRSRGNERCGPGERGRTPRRRGRGTQGCVRRVCDRGGRKKPMLFFSTFINIRGQVTRTAQGNALEEGALRTSRKGKRKRMEKTRGFLGVSFLLFFFSFFSVKKG